jgi:hypothetical protein
MYVKLKFVTQSNSVACLGTFRKLTLSDLRYYVRNHPIHWVWL